jgi:hypothetical protein
MLQTDTTAVAQVPGITRLDSVTLRPGGHAVITVNGTGLKNAQRLWTPFADLRPVSGHDMNAEQAVNVEADIPATVAPGIYPVRMVTAQAASSAAFLVVDDLAAHVPLDGSESRASAPSISVPCCVSSQINPAKSRFVKFAATAEQSIALEVIARRLNSSLDPVLRILSPAGKEVAFCDNVPGKDGDARLSFVPAETGEYVAEIRDVKYGGGAAHFFHLRVGASTLGAAGPSSVILTALKIQAAPLPETEPNDDRDHAAPVAGGTRLISGSFHQKNDVDWYRVHADSPSALCITAHTRDVGSPSDVVLQLWSADNKKLVESDDTGPLDGQLMFSVPAAGDYFLRVSDLAGKGGAEWTYDLEVDFAVGRLEVTAPADVLNIPRGGNASLVLTVKRIHMDAPVLLNVEGLPVSLRTDPIWLGAKQSTVPLTLTAGDAKPETGDDDSGPLVITASIPDQPAVAPVPVTLAPRASKAAEPFRNALIRTDLFAGVAPAGVYSLTAENTQVTVAQGATVTIPVKAVRQADWTFPVDLALSVPADQLPPGITVTGASMAATDAVITIAAAADAAPGKFTLFTQGTSKKDDKNIVIQPVPSITITVSAAVAASTEQK